MPSIYISLLTPWSAGTGAESPWLPSEHELRALGLIRGTQTNTQNLMKRRKKKTKEHN
jgi:hypothetical protein